MAKALRTIFSLFFGVMLLGLTVSSFAADTYEIDASHSTIGFAVKHLQVGTTRGGFDDYAGTVTFDENDLSSFAADMTIQAKSINTRNEGRDNHLRGGEFFDTETHPTITFNNAKLEQRGEGHVIIGDLTIRGVTKQITIPVTLAGPVQGPSGAVIGINGQTFINRQDFGVSWSKQLDNGGLVVDDTVNLIIEIEAQKKS